MQEFFEIFHEDMTDKQLKWKQKLSSKEKDFDKNGWNCQVAQRPMKGGGVDLVRIDAKMRNIEKDAIMKYWMNPPKDKASMIKECRTVQEFENGDVIVYFRFKVPLMNDRDNVCFIHQETAPEELGGDFIQCTTVEHDDCPEVQGVVRMYQTVSGWIRPDPNDSQIIHYTELDNFDMKGNFPARLMNMMIASESKKEFGNLYNHCKNA